MKGIARGLSLLLLAGCGTSRAKAEEKRVLVEVGMSARDVVGRIGRPAKVFPVARETDQADQTVEVWAYNMKVPPDLGDAAEVVVNAGALVALVVLSKGNDVNQIGNVGPRNKGYFTFWVGFGFDGKVRGVSTLESTPP